MTHSQWLAYESGTQFRLLKQRVRDAFLLKMYETAYDAQRVIQSGEPLVTLKETLENYNLVEQLVEANLNLGNIAKAKEMISILKIQGSRLDLLNGMVLEAEGKYEQAMTVYSEIYMKTTNPRASQLLVNCLMNQNKVDLAIEILVDHLDIFMFDSECWYLLYQLYLQSNMYLQAEHCLQEMLVIKPNDHLIMLKLADLLYWMQDYSMALTYYLGSLEIASTLVGWIGTRSCAKELHNTQMDELATREIRKLYKDKLVLSWLESK